jgi:hypothetical protein
MTRADWIEVLVIAILAPASWLVWPYFAPAMPLWQLALSLSALLLAHSLVRDIAILLRNRSSAPAGLRKEAHCFCLESTIGATGVVAGAILAALGLSIQVAIGILSWQWREPWCWRSPSRTWLFLGIRSDCGARKPT